MNPTAYVQNKTYYYGRHLVRIVNNSRPDGKVEVVVLNSPVYAPGASLLVSFKFLKPISETEPRQPNIDLNTIQLESKLTSRAVAQLFEAYLRVLERWQRVGSAQYFNLGRALWNDLKFCRQLFPTEWNTLPEKQVNAIERWLEGET